MQVSSTPPPSASGSGSHAEKVSLAAEALEWLLAAVMWQEQGALLPRGVIDSWHHVCEAAVCHLEAVDPSAGPSAGGATIWVLRFLQRLALHSEPPTPAADDRSTPSTDQPSRSWMELWQVRL